MYLDIGFHYTAYIHMYMYSKCTISVSVWILDIVGLISVPGMYHLVFYMQVCICLYIYSYMSYCVI